MVRSALLLLLVVCTGPVLAKGSAPLATVSQQLTSRAMAAAAQGKNTESLDLYEAAVAADPKNVAAYVGLGRSYEKIGMQGKALRYYRLALDINPNDLAALEAQALGMMAKGAPSLAQFPITRLRKLCPKGCPALTRVDAAANKAAQKSSANARIVPRTILPAKKSVTR